MEAAVEEVLGCARRTLEAESARIVLIQELDFAIPRSNRLRRQGGLLGPIARATGRLLWRSFERWGERNMGESRLEGFIEPSRRRDMESSGAWSHLQIDGKRRHGGAGKPLSSLDPSPRNASFDPWWLLDALRGAKGAEPAGEESVRGTPCRRLHVKVDLGRASASTPDGLCPPAVERFEDYLALPLDVWIDDTYVRRVRYGNWMPHANGALAVELWDFGVSTAHLDWSRLPAWQPEG